MAFPTSGLSNNQVHKEGNRAFVYDSALGVWDQVKEIDRAETKTLSGTIGSEVVFPAGHLINVETQFLPIQDQVSTGGTAYVNYWSPQYTPHKNNSTIYAWLHIMGMHQHNGNWQPVWTHKYSITGDDITNLTNVDEFSRGWENPTSSNNGTWMEVQHCNLLRPVTLDGTGTAPITYVLYFKNNNSAWYSHTLRIYGYASSGDTKGSSITFQEFAQ